MPGTGMSGCPGVWVPECGVPGCRGKSRRTRFSVGISGGPSDTHAKPTGEAREYPMADSRWRIRSGPCHAIAKSAASAVAKSGAGRLSDGLSGMPRTGLLEYSFERFWCGRRWRWYWWRSSVSGARLRHPPSVSASSIRFRCPASVRDRSVPAGTHPCPLHRSVRGPTVAGKAGRGVQWCGGGRGCGGVNRPAR